MPRACPWVSKVETEKASIDIESSIGGYVKLKCKEGEEYVVGFVLAFIVSSIEEYNIMDTEEMIRKKHKDHNKEEIIKNNDVDQSVELKGVKKGLFKNMQKSKEYIQATTFMEVDMQRINELCIQKKYSYTSFIVHAVIKVLIKYPMINSIFLKGS